MIATTPFEPTRSRVFLTYGCTAEKYCLASGITVDYEKFMHDHLKRNGFETVVFFSHHGCRFLDHESRDVAFAKRDETDASPRPTAPMKGAEKLLRHSTGLRALKPQTPRQTPKAAGGDRLHFQDLARPEQMLPLVRQLFRQGRTSLAVVFSSHLIHAARASTETNTQFRAFVCHDLGILPIERRAVMIFNLPGNDPWEGLRAHPWDFLLGDSNRSFDGAALPVFIGDPCADEVERYLQTLHVRDDKPVEIGTFADNVSRLTAHLRALRQRGDNRLGLMALGRLNDSAAIDAATVDQFIGSAAAKPALTRLDALVGLATVKKYLKEKMAEAAYHRRGSTATPRSPECQRLVPAPMPGWRRRLRLHVVLQGNPGTGKTTVAQLMGDLYRDAGLLDVGHVVKATRADLVGQYVGHTAPRVQAAVNQALGGILFIDEAYDLCRGDDDDFGQEAVATLTEAMSANDGRLAVVLAGYPDDMKRFLATNDGLSRRFNEILTLDDYGPAELETILRSQLTARESIPAPDLDSALPRLCDGIYATRDRSFGNAGAMEQLADAITRNRIIQGADQAGVRHLPTQEAQLLERPAVTGQGVLEELDSLVGLQAVKSRVRTIFNRLAVERQRGSGREVVAGHMVFSGNPGTGKTTVARLMARQFHAVGLLPRPEVHETTAASLIAGYVGQTTVRTREFLESGIGRLIFIDEAHQLARGSGQMNNASFGRDVIDALVPFAENHRHECVIVLAGYTDAMAELIRADDGLASRFPQTLAFEDYAPEDLVLIFDAMIRHAGFTWPTAAGRDRLVRHFARLKTVAGRGFGNARAVRGVVNACLDRHANRLSMLGTAADRGMLSNLTLEDLPDEA
jgi:SpoVK/Ycf46/Vps4 family AAA+-type ATPase